MQDPNEDPLKKYRNTNLLYKDVKLFLSQDTKGRPRITKETPLPVVTVWVNKCIKRFTYKKKPPIKVLFLCYKYLDEIGYKY